MANVKTSSLIDATDLKIIVKADGFVDTGATVQLKESNEEYQSTIYLVKEETGAVSDGIFVQMKDNLTDIGSDGVTTKAMTLMLDESPETPSLSITIPEGVQLMDDEGNAVVAKSASMVRFDPSEENVLDAYPGGLNVQADVGGTMEQVDFKSAGFASIVLKDETGKKVKRFDKDITIAMQFKKGTTDGDGKVVEIDDTVPIWSYNEDKGTWVYEEDGIVKDLNTADNLYDVVYDTDHLTYFNLDWKTDVCDARIELKDNGNVVQNNVLKVVLKLNDFNINQSFIYKGDGFIELLSLPDSRDWEIQFLDPITNEVIDSQVGTTSICGDRTIAVDLPSIGDLPVTSTEVAVNLYCGTNVQQTADVRIYDENNFLIQYGLSINSPFDLRTGNDGVLSIYDLPRSFFDKIIDVNAFATEVDTEIVSLALDNTPGPFPVKIGSNKEVNEIKLVLPESYCEAGGFTESKITATLTCPSGNVPNFDLQTIPFVGLVEANISGSSSPAEAVKKIFESGSASLQLLSNTDYELTLTSLDPTIAQNITNNNATEVITAGDEKTYDFILTDEYCNGTVEDLTYTYTSGEGIVVTETPFINTVGSIDLADYFPSQTTTLNYTTFSKSSFTPDQPEFEDTESVTVTVTENTVSEVEEYGKTDFVIEADRIRVQNFDEDLNGDLQIERDAAFGRLYNVGNQIYKTKVVGDSTNTFEGITTTTVSDFDTNCILAEALNTFSQKGFDYSGDIIKIKCDFVGTISIVTTGTEELNIDVNETSYTYLKKGVGEIADTQDNCVPEGGILGNNTAGCTVNDYEYRFLIE